MADSLLQRAVDLAPQVKRALEVLLGRSIQADECVSVRAYRPRAAPQDSERESAYRRLLDRVDRSAARTKNVADGEVDAAIDEAAEAVRHEPE